MDGPVVRRLRADGHVVAYVAETTPGVYDDDVLGLARAAGALLLTADRDFGELVYRQRLVTAGVLLYRLAGMPLERKAERVAWALAAHGDELAGAFAVLSADLLRIRPLPAL